MIGKGYVPGASPPSAAGVIAANFFLITPQVLAVVLSVLKPAASWSFGRSTSGGPDLRQDQATYTGISMGCEWAGIGCMYLENLLLLVGEGGRLSAGGLGG